MKFYIFRHAETFSSKYGISYGKDNLQSPILFGGKEAIIKLANYLKDIFSDFNVSSPYERCKETVEIISKITDKQFVFDKRIGEYMNISYEKLKKRLLDFLNEINKKGYKSVLICTHGAVVSLLVHLICDINLEETVPLSEYKDTGDLVVIEDKTVKTIDFNHERS